MRPRSAKEACSGAETAAADRIAARESLETPDGSHLPAFIVPSERRSADFGHHPYEQRHPPVGNYPWRRQIAGMIVGILV